MTLKDLETHTSPQVIEYLTELEARFAPIEKAYAAYLEHTHEPEPAPEPEKVNENNA